MEKKIRIATVDRCVMCGEIISEGQQVCISCEKAPSISFSPSELKSGIRKPEKNLSERGFMKWIIENKLKSY